MLAAASPSYLHLLQNLSLILISLFFLPLSTFVLFVSYALHPTLFFRYNFPAVSLVGPFHRAAKSPAQQVNGNIHPYSPSNSRQSHHRAPATVERPTILVTGVGMSKGLHIARAFHLSHHRVLGADSTSYSFLPSIGRFSRAIDKFYDLPLPIEEEGSSQYIQALVNIIKHESVGLWVSCSGVSSALDDARAKEVISLRHPSCTCIQFDAETTQLLHEKDTFATHAASLGLPVPETHTVTTRGAVHKVLHESPRTKRRYVMKSIKMNDASRGEINTLLPRRTLSETYNHLARMPISESNPWVLQQYVPGNREYCTHSLVVRGKVKAFVACPSSELLMHYQALPHPEEALSRAMLCFTEEFARKCHYSQQQQKGEKSDFTGHLSFDFLVEEQVTARGVEHVLRAIECNPRPHTAVTIFRGEQGSEMVQAYLSALERDNADDETKEQRSTMNGTNHDLVRAAQDPEQTIHSPPLTLSPTAHPPVYWLAHDLVTLLLHPFLNLILHPRQLKANLHTTLSNIRTFLTHLLTHHDGAYETWDPLPAWLLYHVYWPGVFASSLATGQKWSRMNVSTGQVFKC